MRIIVRGSTAKLVEGKHSLIYRATRIKDPGAKFDPRYRQGSWDGYHVFYDFTNQTFPAGFMERVERKFRNVFQQPLEVRYPLRGLSVAVDRQCLFGIDLWEHQVGAVSTALRKLRLVIEVGTGGGKTEIMAAICFYLLQAGIAPILILVPGKGLLRETAQRLGVRLGGGVKIGLLGDGRRPAEGCNIVVATPDTAISGVPYLLSKAGTESAHQQPNRQIQRTLESAKALLVDEAHKTGANEWYDTIMHVPANVRVGFTATPERQSTLHNARLEGAIGRVGYKMPRERLIEKGLLATPRVFFVTDRKVFGKGVDYSHRFEKGKELLQQKKEFDRAIVNNSKYNANVARLGAALVQNGLPTLILAQRIGQHRLMLEEFKRLGVKARFLYGPDSPEKRAAVLRKFAQRGDFALLATTIFDLGVDAPAVRALVLAGGGKDKVTLRQRTGRGLRRKEGVNELLLFDFSHSHNGYCCRHAVERLEDFAKDKFEINEVEDFEAFLRDGLPELCARVLGCGTSSKSS